MDVGASVTSAQLASYHTQGAKSGGITMLPADTLRGRFSMASIMRGVRGRHAILSIQARIETEMESQH